MSLWTCAHQAARQRAAQIFRQRRSLSSNSRFLQVSEEIRQAISERRPVVALESTIYTHGFPYPDNIALASRLEHLVRVNGGVPATIGILDGVARVGFGADELERLVSSAGSSNMLKISRRDLGFACGLRDGEGRPFNGGTTIAATMILAHLAGIKVFATGGLGGVHRGVEETWDVSADLTELGRTPVTVISSGCKSFLDIAKTLEVLETHGVAVATFADGRTGKVDFPSFYSRDSGIVSPVTLQTESDAARVIHAHLSLGLTSGLVFANPIPEQHSIPHDIMEISIIQALEEAKKAGSSGAAATPYILAKIKELTGSKSVQANRALVEANIIRGTKVANELAQLEREDQEERSPDLFDGVSNGVSAPPNQSARTSSKVTDIASQGDLQPQIFVAGSLALDLACDYAPRPGLATGDAATTPVLHTSNPARITQSLGGVGSNVARAAHLMGARVRLCSAVGDDMSGKAALEGLISAGMSTAGVKTMSSRSGSRTAQYIAINDGKKDLHLAIADMSILESTETGEDTISAALDSFWLPQLQEHRPSHLVIDGNWPTTHLARWLQAGKESGAFVTFEPVSNMKAANIFRLAGDHALPVFPNEHIQLATPNAYELAAMYATARDSGAMDRSDWWEVVDAFGIPQSGARTQLALATSSHLVDQGIPQQTLQLLPFIPRLCIKLGAAGVLCAQIIPANDDRLRSREYAPYILSRCTNETEESLGVGGVYLRLFPAAEVVAPEDVVSVNGVGDTFVGTMVAGLAKEGKDTRIEDFADIAQRAAVLTLKSAESVSPGLGTLRLLL